MGYTDEQGWLRGLAVTAVALLMSRVSSWHTWLSGPATPAVSMLVGEALFLRGCSLDVTLWELLWRYTWDLAA